MRSRRHAQRAAGSINPPLARASFFTPLKHGLQDPPHPKSVFYGQPRHGWAQLLNTEYWLQIPRWLGSDPLSAWWLGLAPATLEFWVRFPNERNQGKQAHPVLKYRVPHGSQKRRPARLPRRAVPSDCIFRCSRMRIRLPLHILHTQVSR